MRRRKLGRLGEVSELAFGGAAVSGEGGGYGFGAVGEKEAVALLKRAFDRGVDVFDTAPVYGYGLSERRIGLAFSGMREKVFLVSKCGVDWDDAKKMRVDNSPAVARRMLERSLRDLRTDYLDLYFIHWPDEDVDVRDTMEELARAKREGKIRAIGLSNFYDPAQIARAEEVERVDALQAEFHLFAPRAREALFPLCRERGIGFMSWGTFDKGILTGRVTRGRSFEAVDFRSRFPAFVSEAKLRAMDRIRPLLEEAGYDGRALALGFVLGHPEASTAVCGVRTIEQLDTALGALERLPPSDLVERCRRVAEEELSAPA